MRALETGAMDSPLPASAPAGPPRIAAGGSTRILLAEDNLIASELIALMLRRLGHAIQRAANGLDAVDMVHSARQAGEPHALLLCDVMMPVMTGPEAARRLRADGIAPADLPIVAVTAGLDPAEIRACLAAGMQACLAKPVSIGDLAAAIDAWLPRTRAGAQARARNPSQALRKRYELRKHEVLEKFAIASAAPVLSPDLVAELREHLHKLAGTAGSFGETALSEAAARGEALLVEAARGDLPGAVAQSLGLLRQVA